MMASLLTCIVGTVAGTWLLRLAFLEPSSISAAALAGGVAGALFLAPVAALMLRLWDEAHGLTQLAKLFLHNDNFAAKALTYLDSAIRLTPEDSQLYDLRGLAYSRMDEPHKARTEWARASELSPDDPSPHVNRGIDHLRRNESEAAIQAFATALDLDPESSVAHNNLGTALERRGDFEKALEHYSRAIEIQPDYAMAFSNRANVHLRRGDCERAVSDCERALSLDSRLAIALVNRGHALKGLSALMAASESYEAALELGGSPAVEAEALAGLKSLEGARAVA